MKRLRRYERGISNVIVVMLSLFLVVIIVSNVILWSYRMNQFDWERMQENVEITNVSAHARGGAVIALQNKGSVAAHLVSLWVDSPLIHQKYDMDLFINAGDSINYTRVDMSLDDNESLVKIITERGTTSMLKFS
jgi:hypothetical protein